MAPGGGGPGRKGPGRAGPGWAVAPGDSAVSAAMLPLLLRRAWVAAASRRGTRRCSLGACCSYRLRDARECRRPPLRVGSRFPQGGGGPSPLEASTSRRLRRAGRRPEPPPRSPRPVRRPPTRGSPTAHRVVPCPGSG